MPDWHFTAYPHFSLPEFFPGMTPTRVTTLLVIRSFCYAKTKANDGYNKCTASLATLGKRSRQSRATVERNLSWLEGHYLIYRIYQGWNKPKAIIPLDDPQDFKANCQRVGRDEAIRMEERAREEAQQEEWKENAKGNRPRHYANRNGVSSVRPQSPDEGKGVSPVRRGGVAGETGGTSPVRLQGSHQRDPKKILELRSSEEEVYEAEHHPKTPDDAVSGLQPSPEKTQEQTPTPGQPLAEGASAPPSEVPVELRQLLSKHHQKANGNGKPIFMPEPWSPDRHKEFRKQFRRTL